MIRSDTDFGKTGFRKFEFFYPKLSPGWRLCFTLVLILLNHTPIILKWHSVLRYIINYGVCRVKGFE